MTFSFRSHIQQRSSRLLPWPWWRRRLDHRPFLRQLFAEPGFGIVILAVFCAVPCLAALLPRIWRSTPHGIHPIVRVRGLDLVQARWHRKESLKSKDRIASWMHARSALAHDPGNPEHSRTLLRLVAGMNTRDREVRSAGLGAARWLLQLTSTNVTDATLVLQTLWHLDAPESQAALLRTPRETNAPDLAAWKSAFLLAMGDLPSARVAASAPAGSPTGTNGLDWLGTVGLATTAAMQGTIESKAAWDKLGQLCLESRAKPETIRLRLVTAQFRKDVEAARLALAWLERRGLAGPNDHARLWRTLHAASMRAELKDAVMRFCSEPLSAQELFQSARAMLAVGESVQAEKYLSRYANLVGNIPEVWELRADICRQTGRWEDLRSLAVAMRVGIVTRKNLSGLADYFEKQADAERERRAMERRNRDTLGATTKSADLASLTAAH